MVSGIVNVYKEPGFTSFDVVAKCRGIFKQKKIGHAGTLDPIAEGVLVILLGSATKLSDYLTVQDKVYEATALLGRDTDTYDISGQTLAEASATDLLSLTEEKIMDALNSFVGKQMQLPPIYSALKKDGKKLYEYAREGKEVEIAARPIEIYSIQLLTIDGLGSSDVRVRFLVHCSKGTYIRSLCHDLGQKLSVHACMEKLIRKETYGLSSDDGLTLGQLQELKDKGCLNDAVEPLSTVLASLPKVKVKDSGDKLLINGNKLQPGMISFESQEAEEMFFASLEKNREEDQDAKHLSPKDLAVFREGKIYAIYRYDEDGQVFKLNKMLRNEG